MKSFHNSVKKIFNIKSLNKVALGLLVLGSASCGKHVSNAQENQAKVKRFHESTRTSGNLQEVEGYQLTTPGVEGIPHKLMKQHISDGRYFFDSAIFNVEFGKLSRADFKRLQNAFGSWSKAKSKVVYSSIREYAVTDFLPPLIQATEGMHFTQITEKLPSFTGGEKELLWVSNCWGTSYELLRQSQKGAIDFNVFYMAPNLVNEFFRSDEKTDLVKEYTKDPEMFADPVSRNEGLEIGDVLMIGKEYLQHTAIYIANDLFFEKAGVGETALYRLTHFDLLYQTWKPALFGWEYRRVKTELPHPSTMFTLNEYNPSDLQLPEAMMSKVSAQLINTDTPEKGSMYFFMQDIPMSYEATGRAYLREHLFSKRWFTKKVDAHSSN